MHGLHFLLLCADMMSLHQHARRFIHRSDKHESGTAAAANDIASVQGLLGKEVRKEIRKESLVKDEKRKSKTPKALERSGPGSGSKHNPVVID